MVTKSIRPPFVIMQLRFAGGYTTCITHMRAFDLANAENLTVIFFSSGERAALILTIAEPSRACICRIPGMLPLSSGWPRGGNFTNCSDGDGIIDVISLEMQPSRRREHDETSWPG